MKRPREQERQPISHCGPALHPSAIEDIGGQSRSSRAGQ